MREKFCFVVDRILIDDSEKRHALQLGAMRGHVVFVRRLAQRLNGTAIDALFPE